MLWTSKVIECLEKSSKEKIAEFERKKKDINNIMSELTELCLSDLNKLKRMKVETLVTIHVHQRDLFVAIYDMAKKN
jgi:dynein heavy chain